jgi:4-amino-4-deoxy-L-arabinose transferase-like glycosyltransferase
MPLEEKVKRIIGSHYQVIGVLIASFLVTVFMGTYTNWDSQLEYNAVSNVITQGFPFVSNNSMINQPPLGFYLNSIIFRTAGLSYQNGVNIVSVFGLGCVLLIYAIGYLLYGKTTGLVASALFGFIPWQVFMSRIYLIDTQYLFFSLLFLTIGILAVQKNSEKLWIASGTVFAIALLTKLFSILIIVPLLLIIQLNKKHSLYSTPKKILTFIAPSIILQTVWFGIFAHENFIGVYFHSDFLSSITEPSLLFLPHLILESTGWLIVIAAVFSLTLTIVYHKKLRKIPSIDILCLSTILLVAGLDLFLVFSFNLTAPYFGAFKYNFLAVPFLCLLAASLLEKTLIISPNYSKRKIKPLPIFGLTLLLASILESIVFLNQRSYLYDFSGYTLQTLTPPNAYLQVLHYAAFALVTLSLTFPLIVKQIKKNK